MSIVGTANELIDGFIQDCLISPSAQARAPLPGRVVRDVISGAWVRLRAISAATLMSIELTSSPVSELAEPMNSE